MPALGQWRQGGPWESLVSQPSIINESQVPVRNSVSIKQAGWLQRNDPQGWILASTPMHMCTLHTWTCSHTYTKRMKMWYICTHTYICICQFFNHKTEQSNALSRKKMNANGDYHIKQIKSISGKYCIFFLSFIAPRFIKIHKIMHEYITEMFKWNHLENKGTNRRKERREGCVAIHSCTCMKYENVL